MRELDGCPNVLRLYEIYESENNLYMVLELINGGDLRHKIKSSGHISEKISQVIIFNLLETIQNLNRKHIMHRDLKPENVLMREKHNDTDILLADFG